MSKIDRNQRQAEASRKLLHFFKQKCAGIPDGKYQISRSKISAELGLKLTDIDTGIAYLNGKGLLTVHAGESVGRAQPSSYSLEPSPRYFEMLGVYGRMQTEINKEAADV